MKNKVKTIAWVCRDGYLDLFPSILKNINNKLEVKNLIVTHLEKDKLHLEKKYRFEQVEVLSSSIQEIMKDGMNHSNILELSEKYNSEPLIRMMWSTMFEINLSQEDIYNLTVAHILFWEEFIESNSVDILIYERPSVLSSCIAWLICQERKIKCIDFVDTAVDTMVVVDNLGGDYADKLKEKYELISTQKIPHETDLYSKSKKYVKSINTKPKKTNEAILASKITDRRAKIGWNRVLNLINLIRDHSKEKEYYLYSHSVINKIKTNILYIFRYFFHRYINLFDSVNANIKSENYFLYPLFMKKEWSNHMFMTPGYMDPINDIRNISVCLPPGYSLYVKEHYSGFPSRRLKDLLKIKKISNVKLLSPQEDTFKLVRKSKGVITLGSTLGFEAMIMSKPVILTGEPWYKHLPGIYRASRLKDISRLMASVDSLSLPSEEEKNSIVEALYSISGPGIKLPREGTLGSDNVENMSNLLLGYIKNLQ